MKLNHSAMAHEMGYSQPQGYTQFENSKKAVNIEKLVKLWKISKLSADEFMQMIESEVVRKNKAKNK